MGKKKDKNDVGKKDKKVKDEQIEEIIEECTKQFENVEQSEVDDSENNDDTKEIEEQLEEANNKCDEYYKMLQRKVAEFENYKKRTIKEKESLYNSAFADAVQSFLPIVDNMERALEATSAKKEPNVDALREGVEMIFRQLKETLKNVGVEEIESVGTEFDPNLHNAVMHVEDDEYEDGVVVEEFQKGYVYKDKVLRHSTVKVAN